MPNTYNKKYISNKATKFQVSLTIKLLLYPKMLT